MTMAKQDQVFTEGQGHVGEQGSVRPSASRRAVAASAERAPGSGSCEAGGTGTIGANWAGNYCYQATQLHEPGSVDELRTVVARATQIHAIGSRHSFNGVADAAEVVSLEHLDPAIEIDRAAGTVSASAGMRYGDLAQALEREHLALPNMASLPHVTVAGAIATATHGSGDANGNLATSVAALELVTSEGDVLRVARGDDMFAGMVVGLGALGVVTRLTLDVVPTYQVCQQVFECLAWDVLYDRFDEVMSSAYSVSLFTDYGETVNQVWLKHRLDPMRRAPLPVDLFGAPAATSHRNPVAGFTTRTCTDQLGVPGAWLDRLPHFRTVPNPAAGDQVQSEYMIPRQHAVAALRALRELGPEIRQQLWSSEVRTVAADDLWLSTAYGRPTVCLHFAWRLGPMPVTRLAGMVEEALAPFAPRPHWGKVFVATAGDLEARYPRLPDFRRLAARLDARGAFRNDFVRRQVLG